MKPAIAIWLVASLVLPPSSSIAQVNIFPYTERFDSVTVPSLPQGWTASGFTTDSGTTESGSICVLAKGNFVAKHLTTPVLNLSNRFPDRLTFFERRSETAKNYRIEVRASVDRVNFGILLASFASTTSTTSYVQRTVQLNGFGMENQANVQIRWLLLVADSVNNTGMFRIDDVTVITLASYDLAAVRLTVQPTVATSKDSLVLSALVRNLANQTATNYNVNLFYDLNNNSIPDGSERFAVIAGPSILASDSATIIAGHSPLKPGDYKLFAVVSLQQDERTSNDTAATSVGYPRGSMLINEIMYAPVGDEPEWVELCNVATDTTNMKNWKIF